MIFTEMRFPPKLRLTIATVTMVGGLGVLTSNMCAREAPTLSKTEVGSLIANARSAADHQKLAAYYRSEAERLESERQDHLEEAGKYSENKHARPKYASGGQHCRALAGYYGKAAQKARSLAEMHEGMARDVK